MPLDSWLEKNQVPDWLIRIGIRRLLEQRLREEARDGVESQKAALTALIADLKRSPIAIETKGANEQHYEVPTRFYELCLGRRLKYSGAYWPGGVTTLDQAEEAMLKLTCERARIADGQEILELGCGWGSLSLWLAENFPHCRVTGVSNSATQKKCTSTPNPANADSRICKSSPAISIASTSKTGLIAWFRSRCSST